MPMTPFIGVRISWLMVARNRDLARLAASAVSLARRSSSADSESSRVRASTSCSRRRDSRRAAATRATPRLAPTTRSSTAPRYHQVCPHGFATTIGADETTSLQGPPATRARRWKR